MGQLKRATFCDPCLKPGRSTQNRISLGAVRDRTALNTALSQGFETLEEGFETLEREPCVMLTNPPCGHLIISGRYNFQRNQDRVEVNNW